MSKLSITPLTSVIGAEVTGVNLSQPLGSAYPELREALLDYLVLFFRNQPISPPQQLQFCEHFGSVERPIAERVASNLAEGSVPGVSVLDQTSAKDIGSDRWHSDHMFLLEPPMATMLRAELIPPVGGDTCFASMYAAYEALTPTFQNFLDGLTALHTNAPVVERLTASVYQDRVEIHPPIAHPVVRVHPETGRKALFVSANFTTRIQELSHEESSAVLSLLFEHVKSPEFQCRFHWERGSIAFWDNRAVQHCVVSDFHDRRIMFRTMIRGDAVLGTSKPAFSSAPTPMT